ncbi:MAG: integrase [bacterium]|nr:MAG: integrase [bacterium]
MKNLNYLLKQLCERNRDGSHSTQAGRARLLSQIGSSLRSLGFRHMKIDSLKPKHVDSCVRHMTAQGFTPGTMKNHMSAIRWWAEKIGKPNVVARDNSFYKIPDRQYVTNESKAVQLTNENLEKIADRHVQMSLILQSQFGLRREESMKINPSLAVQGDRCVLKASWCKGGRGRSIPIRTQAQRNALESAKQLAGRGSLIPPERTYKEHLRIFEKQTKAAGISHTHGLRHEYAQTRYEELTGWKCPAAGGTRFKELTDEQKLTDSAARIIISNELGHSREEVTAVYLGR